MAFPGGPLIQIEDWHASNSLPLFRVTGRREEQREGLTWDNEKEREEERLKIRSREWGKLRRE